MHNMHNKRSDSVEIEHGNQVMRKSKSTSNLSPTKKKINQMKIEMDFDQTNKSSTNTSKLHGNISPNHRRRSKRSSINNNSLLSTVTTVHEFMSLMIHKDDPPTWLKQTDLYREYLEKCRDINAEQTSLESSTQYHQQSHRKQRCNLQMYARSSQSWKPLSSPPLKSPNGDQRSKLRYHSNESLNKSMNHSPIQTSMDFSTPLNISIKHDPIEENVNKSKSSKQPQIRRRQMLCKKKLPQNGLRRRQQRLNSVENHEPLEKKDSSSRSSSENDSNTSTSSSIDHTSPSPTTTVSASSSHQSSPQECMRTNTSLSTTTRFSSPLRIQTSLSPDLQSNSTPKRRSTRIWAPSNFYLNPMWIIPNTTPTSSKRLLVQNSSAPISSSTESNKRPRRRCRS